MGQSGFDIMDSDESLDVQYKYFEKYNAGKSPQEINEWFRRENSSLYENKIIEDCTNFWLGLAFCQWEVKALEPFVAERVKEIVQSGIEKEDYEENYPQRKKCLERFLVKLGKEKKTAKKPVRQKLFEPAFKKGDVITYPIYDLETKTYSEMWGLSICVAHSPEQEKFAYSLFVNSSLEKPEPATMEDFRNAYTLAGRKGDAGIERKNMFNGVKMDQLEKIKKIGTADVRRSFDPQRFSSSLNWYFSYDYRFEKGGEKDRSEKMTEAIAIPDSPYSEWAEKIIALESMKYNDPRKGDPEVYRGVADFLLKLRKEDENAFRNAFTPFVAAYIYSYPGKMDYMFRSIVKSAGYPTDLLE